MQCVPPITCGKPDIKDDDDGDTDRINQGIVVLFLLYINISHIYIYIDYRKYCFLNSCIVKCYWLVRNVQLCA